jgi:tetratricopeptide (TPR) repeat protein
MHLLDRHGNRIDRRNPQDIFTPLYNHQIPPGAGQVVHYRLDVPADVTGPIELRARVRYRKFDYTYMKLVHKDLPVPKLPIVDMCEDRVTLPVAGGSSVPAQTSPIQAVWQRWNDYGIGCLLEGGPGMKRGELRQAEEAFRKLLTLGVKDAVWHGHVNRARVLIEEGRLQEAAEALGQARTADPPAPWWLLAWFNGLVTTENATEKEHFDAAIADFERIVDPANQPRDRRFDFGRDYVVLNKLGNTLFKRSQLEGDDPAAERRFLERAVAAYERTLAIDPEDLDAHFGLYQCYARLGRDVPSVDEGGVPPPEARQEVLNALGEQIIDTRMSPESRVQAALKLGDGATAWGREPTQPDRPRLPTYQALIVKLRPAFHAEAAVDVRAALATALGHLHREVHALLKPDDIARARTAALYRQKNPAANHAAEAIVIYPTRREGAPGQ